MMYTTDELFLIQRRLTEMADMIACAIIRRQQPAADLLTKREAYAFAGRQWIDSRLADGRLTAKRKGRHLNSPYLFSRMEIAALQEAERLQEAQLQYAAEKNNDQYHEWRF